MQTTDTPEDLYIEGQKAANLGSLQDALAMLSKALIINPEFADAHYEYGNVLRRLDRTVEAESALRNAIRLNPGLAEAYFSLAFLLRDQGRLKEIEQLFAGMADALPNDRKRIEQAAGLLAEYGCLSSALDLFERARHLEPDLPRLYLRTGQMQQKLGRFSDAQASLFEAIRRDPQSGPAYLLLANNGRATDSGDERLGLCRGALEDPSLPENTRICLNFALGKLLDDTGDYQSAFEYFSTGNRLRHTQQRFEWTTWRKYFLDLRNVLPTAAVGQAHPETPVPVFIVGMPRSGTTLVHRLLANHPDVFGLGETEMVDQLVETLAAHTATPYPECLARLQRRDFTMLAREYRNRWPREAMNKRYILDKNPLNFLHIGLICRVFPEARFIHCERDPRDVAVSVYFQDFAHPRNSYAYDLADIGHFYSGYHELMKHWQSVFGRQIYPLRYEHLVQNAEHEMRALLAALELDWNDVCIAPELGLQEISTASVWQARQPLYTDSIGRWRHYADQLKPFTDIVPTSA